MFDFFNRLYIRHGMDNGLHIGMVITDLQKAFATMNHSLLSDKLLALGLNNISVSNSYLTDRTQKVSIYRRGDPFVSRRIFPHSPL